ncbi:unnamed protein product [Gongylonema pulchrum]|uniref:Uncharacterized protein n=1 Tax=Gongylonema pulchrum TaxID=637853 RepID=A0A183EPJ3_9BILA|nr:unnamed protein product [Gongylonema pulchrum]
MYRRHSERNGERAAAAAAAAAARNTGSEMMRRVVWRDRDDNVERNRHATGDVVSRYRVVRAESDRHHSFADHILGSILCASHPDSMGEDVDNIEYLNLLARN